MPRVIHFEIHSEDPERAINFYQNLFGWQFHRWEGPWDYWLISTGDSDKPGINGGLMRRQGTIDGQSVIAYVCTVDIESVDEAVEKALSFGGQLALPKQEIPGVGFLAYCKDTEGNIFGMMQDTSQAK
ncbi:MAG: VOC family protein [Acidobacteriota bacterium]